MSHTIELLEIMAQASCCLFSTITGCAVVQHCCKGDQPFQWDNPKFDPPVYPKPLNFSHQNLHRWLCLAYLLMCKIWWKSVHGGGASPRIGEI